jgi:hypothetical protein
MKQMLSAIAISSVLWGACSPDLRESKVPSVVRNTVATQFSGTSKVEWEKERQNYEAEFWIDTVGYTVLVNPEGTLLRFKHEIPLTLLPPAVQQTLQSQYAGFEVEDAEKIEQGGQTFYQVEVEKGLKEMRLVLTPEGAITNSTPFWD